MLLTGECDHPTDASEASHHCLSGIMLKYCHVVASRVAVVTRLVACKRIRYPTLCQLVGVDPTDTVNILGAPRPIDGYVGRLTPDSTPSERPTHSPHNTSTWYRYASDRPVCVVPHVTLGWTCGRFCFRTPVAHRENTYPLRSTQSSGRNDTSSTPARGK